MGYAIADAALASGHEVVLISGPVALTAPEGAYTVNVISAEEMFAAVEGQIGYLAPGSKSASVRAIGALMP